MKKSKLLKLLETFSKDEMKQFEKFITSPYFNKGRNYKPLWKILKSHHPDFDNPNLSEEKLFKKLYPGKVFDNKSSVTLRVLLSQLTSMAKKYVSIEAIENEPGRKLLSRSLRHGLMLKGLNEEARFEGFENLKLSKEQKLSFVLFENLIYVNQHISSSYQFDDNQLDGWRYNCNIPLYNIACLFSQFSMIINNCINSKRRYNQNLPGMKTIKNIIESFDLDLLDIEFEEDETGTKKFISLYYFLCKAMLDINDDISLSKAITLYKESVDKLGESQGIFTRLHNMLRARAYESDYEKYGKINNDLSDFILNSNFYDDPHNKHFRAVAFASILEFKISFMDNDCLKSFIDKHGIKIHDDLKENMKVYSYAWLYFKQRNFEKVLESLSKIHIADISFKDNIYKLKIAAQFDLKLYEESILTIDAFEHYLNNNKSVSEFIKLSGKNFTSSIRSLIKALTGSEKDIDLNGVLKKNINSVFGYWFKEKIETVNNINSQL